MKLNASVFLFIFLILFSCKSGKISITYTELEISQLNQNLIQTNIDTTTQTEKAEEIFFASKTDIAGKNIQKSLKLSVVKKLKIDKINNRNPPVSITVKKVKRETSFMKPNSLAYWSLALFLFSLSMLFVPYFPVNITLGVIIFFISLIGSLVMSKIAMKKIAASKNQKGYYLAKFVFIFSIIFLSMFLLLLLFSA